MALQQNPAKRFSHQRRNLRAIWNWLPCLPILSRFRLRLRTGRKGGRIRLLETIYVRLRSTPPIGNGMALLSGTMPRIGDNLDVEVDLNEVFSWGRNLTASSGRTPSISVANGITQITAELIPSADEECSLTIRRLNTPN